MSNRIRLVQVTREDRAWKGTWYRIGQRHFVRQKPGWPRVYRERWMVLTPGVWGGIDEADCRVLSGPLVWLRCLLRGWRETLSQEPPSC